MTNSYPFVVSFDEFKGKRVLVAGGTKSIGAAIARRFELNGASVATTARSELDVLVNNVGGTETNAGGFEHKPLALSVTQSMGLRTLWRHND